MTHYVLFFINLADRAVHIAGITANPTEQWMLQAARNMLDVETGFLRSKHFIIVDLDTKYTDSFVQLLASARIQVIRVPPASPNLNAYAERFVRSIKKECLEKMIFYGQASLRRAMSEYVKHYHFERNHQGLRNVLIRQESQKKCREGQVRRYSRLGGMLNHYERVAA